MPGFAITHGARVIDSPPPATTTPASPERTACAAEATASVVVDCETGPVRLGLAGELARELRGTAVTLDELRAEALTGLVKDVTDHHRARRAA
ncbi:hypothetical protein ADL27_24250 [Streptomyces sp. NRRL F-6602]|nr:hypothetical protein ADL27_24250 [Streptomyces sp. NRRL F-6602]